MNYIGRKWDIMNDVTVLIVDDESRMRKLIKDFLMQKNYKILMKNMVKNVIIYVV